MQPAIDVIVAVYNARPFVTKCWQALEKNTKYPHKVYFADDCSTDLTLVKFLRELDDATLLRSEKNLGFAGINNWAVNQTEGEFFCLLNSDTEPLEGWLGAMMEAMLSNDRIGVVGAKLLFPEGKTQIAGTIQHAGVGRDRSGQPYHPYRERPADFAPANVLRDVNAVTGACFLVRRKCWDELGGFDEGYSMGQFEDVDYCWRCRENGWKIFVQPKAVLYHYEHGSGEQYVERSHDKNRDRLLRTWRGFISDEYLFPDGKRDDYFPNSYQKGHR